MIAASTLAFLVGSQPLSNPPATPDAPAPAPDSIEDPKAPGRDSGAPKAVPAPIAPPTPEDPNAPTDPPKEPPAPAPHAPGEPPAPPIDETPKALPPPNADAGPTRPSPDPIAEDEAWETLEPSAPSEPDAANQGQPQSAPRDDWGATPEPDAARRAAPTGEDEQDYDDLHALLAEDVVSGASKVSESSSDAPATTYSITGAQLEAYGIRTFADAFNFLSLGLHAEANGSGGANTYGARGLAFPGDGANHFLFVLDGHYINDPQRGVPAPDDVAAIPIEIIDRVELIIGPGSVLYGSNAMLGVVNIVTKPGADVDGVSTYAERSVSPAQSRNGDVQLSRWDDRGRNTRVGLLMGKGFSWGRQRGDAFASAELRSISDPAYEAGPQFIPGTEELFDWGPGSDHSGVWGGHSKSGVRAYNAYGRFSLGGFSFTARSSIGERQGPHFSPNFSDERDSFRVGQHQIDARYGFNLHRRVAGSVRGYWDMARTTSDNIFYFVPACSLSPAPCNQVQDVQGLRVGGEAQLNGDWFGDGRYTTLFGADVAHVDSFGKIDISVEGERYDTAAVADIQQLRVGTYLQQRAWLAPRAKANLGIRWDLQGSQSAFSPRAAFVVDAWSGGTLKLIYSQAFRAPSIRERFDEYPNGRSPAPDLNPEKVRGLELAASQRHGAHNFVLALFGTWWSDMILDRTVNDPDRPTNNRNDQRANLGRILNAGVNAGYRVDRGPLMAHVNANYGWARIDLGGNLSDDSTNQEFQARGTSRTAWEAHGRNQPLEAAPSYWGNAGIAYSFGENAPSLGFSGWFHSKRYIRDIYSSGLLQGALADGASPTVPARARFRLALGGPLPILDGLRYDVTLDVISNVKNADTLGPLSTYHVGDGTSAVDHDQTPRMQALGRLLYRF